MYSSQVLDVFLAAYMMLFNHAEPVSRDDPPSCDCYLVSGDDSGYFQYHRFWDFRSIDNDGDNDYSVAPPVVSASDDQGGDNVTSAFFDSDEFNKDWSIQNYVEEPDASVPSVNSAQNIYITRDPDTDSTYLTLRAFRLPKFASIAELDNNQDNLFHSSLRASMRVIPEYSDTSAPFVDTGVSRDSIDGLNDTHPAAPGAVVGFFTYRSDQQESDIEILTSDPTTNIRYSNQPDFNKTTNDTIPGASTDVVLPDCADWTDWHDHRIDWFEGISRWYLDDEFVLDKTFHVPTEPQQLILNMWSDGGDWSGNMTVGAQAIVGFEWIEMVFNVTGPIDGKRDTEACNVGCNVDNVEVRGTPEVAFDNTVSDSSTSGSNALLPFAGMVTWTIVWCMM